MKVTCLLEAPKLDANRYKKELAKYMTAKLKEAIRAWLKASIEVVPTWSGASRATFEKLARLGDMVIEYGPQKSYKNRKPLGRKESSAKVSINESSGKFYFEWGTSLQYFIINNFGAQQYIPREQAPANNNIISPKGLKNPGPYRIEDRGKKAVEELKITLPNPSIAMTARRIKV